MREKRMCPRCGSERTKSNGSGRFLCRGCGRTFVASTSTVMSSMKLPREKFRAMANLMLNDVKLKAIIDSVGVSTRTAYVWRMKIFAAAFEIQKGATLSGKCWIYAAWIAFKSSVREGGIEERIGLLESHCLQTKASSKAKDRYRVG